MAGMSFRAEPIDKEIVLFLDGLADAGVSASFAELAGGAIDEATDINARALGRAPLFTTYVDGRANAPLDTVKKEGVIVTEYELMIEVLAFIHQQLNQFSPYRTGRYRSSHVLLADNVEITIDTPTLAPQLTGADEYVFINTTPYARRIEKGSSTKAPDGVYQAVANVARRRFTKVAKITFAYRTISGEFGRQRNPAIIVRIGG